MQGIAIAAGVLLLAIIVVPALYRSRSVIAHAPVDERFAPDLRIIRGRTYSHDETTDHCRIFTTERVMEYKNGTASSQTRESVSQVRLLARKRAHAKAQIAARAALRVRFLAVGFLLAAVAVILWILVASVSLSIVPGIVLTAVTALYTAGFVYLLRMWHALDTEDRAILDSAEATLDELRPDRSVRLGRSVQQARTETSDKQARAEYSSLAQANDSADKHADAVANGTNSDATQEHTARTVSGSRIINSAKVRVETSTMPADRVRGAGVSVSPVKIVVPSYTLKPSMVKRTVEPYVAPAADEAPVPYRPQRMGERLGDAAVEAPLEVPDVAAEQPQRRARNDVLGIGETLDSLLDRRRA